MTGMDLKKIHISVTYHSSSTSSSSFVKWWNTKFYHSYERGYSRGLRSKESCLYWIATSLCVVKEILDKVVHKIIMNAATVYGARVYDYSGITKIVCKMRIQVIFVILRVTVYLLIKYQTHSTVIVFMFMQSSIINQLNKFCECKYH
jgi:hypothetical protein